MDFPLPVGLVTRTSPEAFIIRFSTILGKPRSFREGTWLGILRMAPATFPCCRYTLARKRMPFFQRKERSSSLVSSKRFFCFSVKTL